MVCVGGVTALRMKVEKERTVVGWHLVLHYPGRENRDQLPTMLMTS